MNKQQLNRIWNNCIYYRLFHCMAENYRRNLFWLYSPEKPTRRVNKLTNRMNFITVGSKKINYIGYVRNDDCYVIALCDNTQRT